MSFYEDAKIMLLSSFGASKDGKAYTVKPEGGGAPLYVTRGSNLTATRVDSNGLIEKGRENLLLQSNQFDTTWNDGGDYTITSGQDGYDGTTDAWLLQKNTTGNDYLSQSSLSTDAVNTISFYAKEGSVRGVKLVCGGQNVAIDLRDGSTISTGGASGLITAVADLVSDTTDWYRVNLTRSIATSSVLIKPTDENGADVSGSIYIQDAQVEIGLVATEYIESGATKGKGGLLENEPRFNYPIGGGSPHLLLEPSRTNVIGYSEYLDGWIKNNEPIVTQNYGTSPEGVQNSTRFETTSGRLVYDVTTINADETFSVYMRGSGTLRIQIGNDNFYPSVTSEWVRYEFTTTQAVSTNTNVQIRGNGSAVDVQLYGAQYERNSYPTSYIPNHSGGSVSRELELVQTADVSSVIGQQEGTFFLDFEFLDGQTAENQNWIALESEDGQSRVLFYKSSSTNNLRLLNTQDGSTFFNKSSLIAISPNTRYKVAVRYSSGDQGVAVNGSMSGSNGTATYTRTSLLSRVKFNESNIQPSCRVHQAIVFTSGFSDNDLEKLTSGI